MRCNAGVTQSQTNQYTKELQRNESVSKHMKWDFLHS